MMNLTSAFKSFLKPFTPVAILAPVLVACAGGPAKADTPTSQQTAAAEQACSHSMGLKPGNYDYQMCVLSIQQSLTAGTGTQTAARESEAHACAEAGIPPGSGGFDQCVGNLDASMFEAGPGYPR